MGRLTEQQVQDFRTHIRHRVGAAMIELSEYATKYFPDGAGVEEANETITIFHDELAKIAKLSELFVQASKYSIFNGTELLHELDKLQKELGKELSQ